MSQTYFEKHTDLALHLVMIADDDLQEPGTAAQFLRNLAEIIHEMDSLRTRNKYDVNSSWYVLQQIFTEAANL